MERKDGINFPRAQWRHFHRTARKVGEPLAHLPRYRRHDPLAARLNEAAVIAAHAEAGQIAVVQSGMDCDCVRYSGVVTILPAAVMALEAWIERENRAADGPFGYYIERPSAAREVERTSRDLIAEAFEDGHPHVVYA